jgi:acetate kinase
VTNGLKKIRALEGGPLILTINGGSSSIKFAIFSATDPPAAVMRGQVERIGRPGSQLIARREGDKTADVRSIDAADYRHGAQRVIDYVKEVIGDSAISGIGHRVVHGGIHLTETQRITTALVAELKRTQPLDLAHLPREIALIEAFGQAFANRPQIACFDTTFHRGMPTVASMLPIPRPYYDQGVRRFGFHGLSYTYLMDRLAVLAGKDAANGRIILAHLGSGASMAAVRAGQPIDTTMAFTPTAGLVMGTRPGDLDPGLLIYLMRVEKRTPEEMDDFISHQCGLIGVSQSSGDMRDLIEHRSTDARADEAVDLFCYQAKKFVGAFTAALGGLDTLIFSGGIGEHSPEVRQGICQGLEHLGIELDSVANSESREIISTAAGRAMVRVIPTDEEIVIARAVRAMVR